jgi:hypothetical protein
MLSRRPDRKKQGWGSKRSPWLRENGVIPSPLGIQLSALVR